MADYMWEKQAQRCVEVEEEELWDATEFTGQVGCAEGDAPEPANRTPSVWIKP